MLGQMIYINCSSLLRPAVFGSAEYDYQEQHECREPSPQLPVLVQRSERAPAYHRRPSDVPTGLGENYRKHVRLVRVKAILTRSANRRRNVNRATTFLPYCYPKY